MARKPRAKTTSGKATLGTPKARRGTSSASDVSILDRAIDAMLDEAAAMGWRDVTLNGVAARAGLPLGELLVIVPTKHCLLARYLDRLDQLMLGPVTSPDPQDKARDRLFEIIMRRFDAMNQTRDGTQALIKGVARDPAGLATVALRADVRLAAVLTAADISTRGLMGCLRVQGLKAVVLAALRAWMQDDTADMAKTMAALDRALAQAERLARFMSTGRRGEPAEAAS